MQRFFFFFQSVNLTMSFSFSTLFNDSSLGQSPNSSASCPLPGFHPSVMCVHGHDPATQSESEVTQSCPTLCDPMSMGFSRQEYWRGLPFPFPEDLPNTGIKLTSPALQADSLLSEPPGKPHGGVWRSAKNCLNRILREVIKKQQQLKKKKKKDQWFSNFAAAFSC